MPPAHSRTLAWLRELGFPVSPEVDCATGAEGLLAYYRRIGEKRNALPFDIDGVVLDEQRNALGRQRIAHIRDELRGYDRQHEAPPLTKPARW